MEPTKDLADEIYRAKVLQARAMSPDEKVLAGIQLFELACEITRAGIRSENPDADEAEVEAILASRLALRRRLENMR